MLEMAGINKRTSWQPVSKFCRRIAPPTCGRMAPALISFTKRDELNGMISRFIFPGKL
jgi:hypothetical protein